MGMCQYKIIRANHCLVMFSGFVGKLDHSASSIKPEGTGNIENVWGEKLDLEIWIRVLATVPTGFRWCAFACDHDYCLHFLQSIIKAY